MKTWYGARWALSSAANSALEGSPSSLLREQKLPHKRELPACWSRALASHGTHSYHLRSMNNVTQILNAIEQGDPHAAGQLLPLVYDELRRLAAQKLANEKPGQTLEPTALVHEAF